MCGAPCKKLLVFFKQHFVVFVQGKTGSFETVNDYQIRVVIFQQLQVVFEDLGPNMLLQKIQSTFHEGWLTLLVASFNQTFSHPIFPV